jgi:uncharacterized protein (DUF2147 family)
MQRLLKFTATGPRAPPAIADRRLCALALGFASAVAGAASLGCAVAAETQTPAGTWTTIDDHTHEPRSLVEISERDGALSGRIVRLFRKPGEDANPRCVDCKGDRHNQPVLGMTILWNLHRDGDRWDGGEILDPESGETYRVTLRTSEDGTHLDVRGYIGISLLGRTQVWQRAAAEK